MTPSYQTIEIEGQPFHVIAEKEEEVDDGTVVMVVIRLTLQERDKFRRLWQQAQQNAVPNGVAVFHVCRIGVDPQPIEFLQGNYNWWSVHEEAGETYYKQVVRLLPPTQIPNAANDPGLTLRLDHEVLGDVVSDLAERFELLVDELAKSGAITPQMQSALTGEALRDVLTDQGRLEEIRWRHRRVADAEHHLD